MTGKNITKTQSSTSMDEFTEEISLYKDLDLSDKGKLGKWLEDEFTKYQGYPMCEFTTVDHTPFAFCLYEVRNNVVYILQLWLDLDITFDGSIERMVAILKEKLQVDSVYSVIRTSVLSNAESTHLESSVTKLENFDGYPTDIYARYSLDKYTPLKIM